MNGYKSDYKLETKFHEFTDLRDLIKSSAEKYSDKIAFITKVKDEQKKVYYVNTTYKDLLNEMNALGTALVEIGLKGERIAIIGENSYKWCLPYFAAACGIGVAVPLDKLLQKEELEGLLIRSEAKAIFCDKKHSKEITEIVEGGKTNLDLIIGLDYTPENGVNIVDLLLRGEELLAAGNREYLDIEIDRDALGFLLFTSGTTQASKAVMLSHRNIMSCNYAMNCEELFFPNDVSMLFLPLHHIYGMGGLLIFLSQGITNVFCDGLKYIVQNLKEYGVTVMMTVPLLLENIHKKIWKGIDKQGKRGTVEKAMKIAAATEKIGIYSRRKLFKSIIDQMGGKMRFFINGAAALDPVVSKGLNDFGILTVTGYGLTETSPTIASETYRYYKPGSVGKLMPGVEAKIDNPDEDGIGELIVQGDNVMLGYYNNQEATDEVIVDGWFHTGDLAYFDKDEYLYITGRKKNVIVMKNGKNVFPEEIENLINNLPYVSESMVFSMNKASDVVLWAKIVYDQEYLRDEDMTIEELSAKASKDLDKINDTMPSYKMVKHFFLSDRPTIKTTTQKTKRNDEMIQIREELAEREL